MIPLRLFLASIAFVLTAAALAPGAASGAEEGWTFTLTQGESVPSSVRVRNVCSSAQDFRVSTPETPWAVLERDADRLRVAPRSAVEVGIRFESARLARGVYRGEVRVECLDCERDPKFGVEGRDTLSIPTCNGTPQRFPVTMTVVAAGTAGAAPQRPASEVRNVAAAMRDRLADALGRLAARRGLTIVPESLTVLSLPAGGLVAGTAVAGLEALTPAQLAAGAEVLFLHLDLGGAAGGEALPSGEYTLSFRLPAAPAAARGLLLDARGAVVRELAVSAEPLPGGAVLYAVELAPGLALPAWCTAPAAEAAAERAPRFWRGWPLACRPATP